MGFNSGFKGLIHPSFDICSERFLFRSADGSAFYASQWLLWAGCHHWQARRPTYRSDVLC